MKKNWKVYAVWIGIAELVGALSGLLSRKGMQIYSQTVVQPPLSPPMWVFPVVWSVLYGLMGIGAAMVWLSPESGLRSKGLNLFIAQLVVNFFWSLIFFNLQAFGFAFIWLLLLLALVVWMSWVFYQVKPIAGWIQLPYLLWLTFAGYLTVAVWTMNR